MAEIMPATYRLFIALEIPAIVREAIATQVGESQAELPPARWLQMQNAHLTLVFLGGTAVELLPRLEQALEQAAGASRPFTLQVQGAGAFPPRGPARVAWLGFRGREGDIAALASLQRQVSRSVCPVVGIEEERRPFHPHLTVARMRSPWRRDAVERFSAAFGGEYGDPFSVARVSLIRSHLLPGGPRYETMGTFQLGDRANDKKGAR